MHECVASVVCFSRAESWQSPGFSLEGEVESAVTKAVQKLGYIVLKHVEPADVLVVTASTAASYVM